MAVYERPTKKGVRKFYYRFKIDGQEYRRAVKEATSLSDAEKAETVVKGELLRGNFGLAQKRGCMLFDKLIEYYKEYAKNNKRTWKTELCKVNKIAEYFKGKRLKEITPAAIEEFKAYRKNSITKRGETLRPATVNRDLALIKKMFSLAVLNKWIDENPALNCKVPMLPENNEIIRYLSEEEEKDLLDSCNGDYAHLRPIVLTAILTGLRFGEIMHLKWGINVDLKKCCIIITKEIAKSKKQRTIPLSSMLFEEFKKLKKSSKNEYIFVNPKTGKPYTTIRKSWISIKNIAKIDPEFRFHDLRHSMATKLMDKNVNVGVIKDLLGHSSLTITQKYAHAKDNTKRKAVELLTTGLE